MRTSLRRGGRGTLTATCVLAAPVILGAACPALAQQAGAVSPGNGSLVSLDVREAPLSQVITMLTQRTGVGNIVIENASGKGFNPVTLNLIDLPIDRVLRAVAAAAGAALSKEDDIYYIRPKGDGPAAAPAPAAFTTPVIPPPSVTPPPAPDNGEQPGRRIGEKQWSKITFQFMKPSDFVRLLNNPAALTVNGDEEQSLKHARWNEIVPTVQAQPLTPQNPPIIPSGSESPASAAGGFGAGRTDAPFAEVGQRGGGGRGGGGGAFGGGGGGRGGGGGAFGGGGGGQGGANGQIANLLPDGVDPPIAYDVDNSLLVRGDPQGLEELRDIIRLLDIPAKQVLIKAEFVSVTVSDVDSFGIQWTIKPAGNIAVNLPNGASASAGSLNLLYASGNAVANLRMQLTRNTTNVLQAPVISTTNLTTGTVFVGQQIPVFTTTQQVTNNVVNNVTNVQFVPVNNSLTVFPRVNGDNSVTLTVTPTIQSSTLINGPGNIGQVPVVNSAGVVTTRRIPSGETMVLGGFINKSEGNDANGTPILQDLPLIGNLFRAHTRTVQGTETLIFITPTILEDRQSGSVGSVQAPVP